MEHIDRRYEQVIRPACYAAGAAGTIGAVVPAADILAITSIWTTMITKIAQRSGHDVDGPYVTKLIGSGAGAILGYVTGSKILTWFFNVVPGVGTLAAAGVNSALNFWFTWRLGRAVTVMFDRDGLDFEDFTHMAEALGEMLVSVPTWAEMRAIKRMLSDNSLRDPDLQAEFDRARQAA